MATEAEIKAQQLYVTYFNRPADPEGLKWWAEALGRNLSDSLASASWGFANSAEFKADTAGMTNRQIVNKIYQHLFARDGDDEGLNFWTRPLEAKELTLDQLILEIAKEAQAGDSAVFNSRLQVANAFTARIDQPAEVAAYVTEKGLDVGANYLASVVDPASAAFAYNDALIDAAIAQFTVPTRSEAGEEVQLVGVQSHAQDANYIA